MFKSLANMIETRFMKHNNVKFDPFLTWSLQRSVLQSHCVTPEVLKQLSTASLDPHPNDATSGFPTERNY